VARPTPHAHYLFALNLTHYTHIPKLTPYTFHLKPYTFLATYTLTPTPYAFNLKAYTLSHSHPKPLSLYTLHPTPYTLHPTPYTLYPTPYTLHSTLYILHPTPHTLHPMPHVPRPTSHIVWLRSTPHTPRFQTAQTSSDCLAE